MNNELRAAGRILISTKYNTKAVTPANRKEMDRELKKMNVLGSSKQIVKKLTKR
jgi:hypothetical protein